MAGKYCIDNKNQLEEERLKILHRVFFNSTIYFFHKAGFNDDKFSNLSVADVGCATGEMTSWIAKRTNKKVIAIDNDNLQLEKLRKKLFNFNNFETLNLDLNSNFDIAEQVDLTYCRFLLHHLNSPKLGLNSLVNLTKKGGLLIIGEPIIDGLWSYPNLSEFKLIYDLLQQCFKGPNFHPNYGKKLLFDVKSHPKLEVVESTFFRPILTEKKDKLHHSIVLESFSEKFLAKGLIGREHLEKVINLNKKLVNDVNSYTNLFGMFLVFAKKVND